ncbi:fimbrial protein [Pseudomonas sp. NMI795_08]|uniref:fimbrial protein n=1 Tax=Pseudomonas sp. NMI795_08 TaxID=2903144 RepID=UPI001E54F822|nr:hypothetical protein [Pseudomonas sp. NMI795_08]MCE1118543.1 hypothetical protein [Pseudomonas sp. NMI795_08]
MARPARSGFGQHRRPRPGDQGQHQDPDRLWQDLHALDSASTAGLALAIKDNTKTLIAYGSDSKEYDLDDTDPTDMLFSAHYRSIAANVAPGPANTDVAYVFTLK